MRLEAAWVKPTMAARAAVRAEAATLRHTTVALAASAGVRLAVVDDSPAAGGAAGSGGGGVVGAGGGGGGIVEACTRMEGAFVDALEAAIAR